MKISQNNRYFKILAIALNILIFNSCSSFIEVDPPITTTNAGNVYNNDATAAAVLTGIYSNMSSDNAGLYVGGNGLPLMSFYPSLSSDELTLFEGASDAELINYYQNSIKSNVLTSTDFWVKIYKTVFIVNSVIEGLSTSVNLTPAVKTQLLGEAHFIRAFCYFYLTNLYGDVPLNTTTDYKANSLRVKTSTADVYTQIIDDLIKAQSLLSEQYLSGTLLNITSERVRPNRYAATALLARVYLYTNQWQSAEKEATKVIVNTGIYDIVPLNNVFLANSKETIWSLQPVGIEADANTGDGKLFVLPSGGPDALTNTVYLNEDFLKSFEIQDQRLVNWVNSVTALGNEYFYPYKYKIGAVNAPRAEYSIILRIAEQYLIRAEARAKQNKLTGTNSAKSDLDVIRTRAGLAGTTANGQTDMLNAILDERKHELFTEWGHRWLDLKRTKTIDAVMKPVTEKKGGIWTSDDALYAIPLHEIQNNPNLVQNKGY